MYIEILKSMRETFKILFGLISKVSKYIYNNHVIISKKSYIKYQNVFRVLIVKC